MGVFIKNTNVSISVSLTALKLVGFWAPDGLSDNWKLTYSFYGTVTFMFLLGTYIIIQVVDMFMNWGDIRLMTEAAFVLFTNLAQAVKIINVIAKRKVIQAIIDEADEVLIDVKSDEARKIVRSCDWETRIQQILYFVLTLITGVGWATSAENNMLPLRAWYPYDTTRSPAYELTYMHQVGALLIAAYLNVGKDTLVTALMAQCRCRLKLLGLSLRNLCKNLKVPQVNNVNEHEHWKEHFSVEQERIISARIRTCVLQHQAALQATVQLQDCFSVPIFAQFTISLVIICATAFQMVSMTGNMVRLLSMGTYLLNMTYQVFIYCYQGNQLSEESSEIAGAAYECPWYLCSTHVRRSLLIVMLRTRRVARVTACGFTRLSLASFMAIIKASYSLFTLIQQVEEKN